jgi:hypothetical protein
MACIHCGQDGPTEEYSFRCAPDGHEPADVRLGVCDICREVLLTESDIELAESDVEAVRPAPTS